MRGLSTARWTVRLSSASVEMTFVGGGVKQPTAKTEADLYGMTNKGTTARAKTKATAKARAGRGRGYIPTHRDGWGTRAFVVGRTDRFAIAHLNDDKAVVKMGHPGYGSGKMVRGF